MEEGCCSSARSPDTLRCPLRCYPGPTQPGEHKKNYWNQHMSLWRQSPASASQWRSPALGRPQSQSWAALWKSALRQPRSLSLSAWTCLTQCWSMPMLPQTVGTKKDKLTSLQTPLWSHQKWNISDRKKNKAKQDTIDFFFVFRIQEFFQTNLKCAVDTLLQKLNKPLHHSRCVYNFINGWVRLWMTQKLNLMYVFLSGQLFEYLTAAFYLWREVFWTSELWQAEVLGLLKKASRPSLSWWLLPEPTNAQLLKHSMPILLGDTAGWKSPHGVKSLCKTIRRWFLHECVN